MRCKENDMALISGFNEVNDGKMVTCKKFLGHSQKYSFYQHNDLWEIDRLVTWYTYQNQEVQFPYVPDSCLIPIRPDELKEETDKRILVPFKI